MYQGKRVLVTGGTGLIGTHLVRQLLDRGASVRIASLDDASHAGGEVESIRGNLMHWEFCQTVTQGMDYVFHLAGGKGSVGIGETKAASFLVPYLLMNTLTMEAARQAGVERFLYTSSVVVYHPAPLLVEDQAWDGPPHHADRFAGWAKRMGELQAEAYSLEYGWDKIAIVRPSNVYGPYDNFDPATALVIPALIGRVVQGENPLAVWGDGSAIGDFLYAPDCAEGMLLALEKSANCTPINLGSGKQTSIKELVETIVGCFDDPPQINWDTTKPSGQSIRVADTSRAEKVLGFHPRTSLQQGLKETVEWRLANSDAGQKHYNIFEQGNYMETKA